MPMEVTSPAASLQLGRSCHVPLCSAKTKSMLIILLLVLLILTVGAYPSWPHSRQWGYYPSGGLGLVLIILLVLLLMGYL